MHGIQEYIFNRLLDWIHHPCPKTPGTYEFLGRKHLPQSCQWIPAQRLCVRDVAKRQFENMHLDRTSILRRSMICMRAMRN